MNTNAALLRALKGPPVSIVLALLLHPGRSLGAGKLSQLTGYSDKSITHGLETLTELGLAQNHGRYNGWKLTAHCTQLILPASAEAENVRLEPETLRLPAGSSSSTDPDPRSNPTPPTNSTPGEAQNLRLPDPELEAALLAAGIYPALARNLATDPWVTQDRLDAWQAELHRQKSAGHSTIRNPAAVLATNLARHLEPPTQQPPWAKYLLQDP